MTINKPKLVLELIILIGLLIYSAITVMIPTYHKMFGSSDKFINTNKYESFIEFKVGEANFGLVLNKNKEVYHILYFDEAAICLYNQNIENNEIDIVSNQIIRRLIENDYLKTNTIITITKYNNKYYNDVKKSFITYLNKYKLNNQIIEDENNLIDKAKTISQEKIDSDANALTVLDLYSKEIIDNKENDKTIKEEISEHDAKSYANRVYIKIENYINKNNIINLEKNNKEYDITTIKGDDKGIIYPTENSYYYIKNSKVYAYIEIKGLNNIYNYCYNGSIDDYQKGECK